MIGFKSRIKTAVRRKAKRRGRRCGRCPHAEPNILTIIKMSSDIFQNPHTLHSFYHGINSAQVRYCGVKKIRVTIEIDMVVTLKDRGV